MMPKRPLVAFLFLVALLGRCVCGAAGAGKSGGDGAAAPTCEDEPPKGDNIGTLKCPDIAKSVAFRFTAAMQTHEVKADCGLPAPPAGADGEPSEPIVRENCVLQIDACGGQGKSYGGRGGYMSVTIEAVPGTTLYIYVGGWGNKFNGGGSGSCSGVSGFNCIRGGGATDVRSESGGANGSENLESRLVVAGGGGAGGNCQPRCLGGNGGGPTGARGKNPRVREPGFNGNGKGGTQTKGGECSGGFQWEGPTAPCNGKLGKGGTSGKAGLGGAGGGGYYGGGAGVFTGGGGSSWSSGIITANVQGDARCVGNGVLYITPLDQTALPPSQEPTTGPTLPTMAPSEPTFWPTHTPRPTRVSRRREPTDH